MRQLAASDVMQDLTNDFAPGQSEYDELDDDYGGLLTHNMSTNEKQLTSLRYAAHRKLSTKSKTLDETT